MVDTTGIDEAHRRRNENLLIIGTVVTGLVAAAAAVTGVAVMLGL